MSRKRKMDLTSWLKQHSSKRTAIQQSPVKQTESKKRVIYIHDPSRFNQILKTLKKLDDPGVFKISQQGQMEYHCFHEQNMIISLTLHNSILTAVSDLDICFSVNMTQFATNYAPVCGGRKQADTNVQIIINMEDSTLLISRGRRQASVPFIDENCASDIPPHPTVRNHVQIKAHEHFLSDIKTSLQYCSFKTEKESLILSSSDSRDIGNRSSLKSTIQVVGNLDMQDSIYLSRKYLLIAVGLMDLFKLSHNCTLKVGIDLEHPLELKLYSDLQLLVHIFIAIEV